jgi:DNA helicase-2/ATP-dependent DNA helicase PcrA
LARDKQLMAPSIFSSGPLMARRQRVAEAWEQPGRPAQTESFDVGQRVFHEKFGYGIVTSADDDRLDIEFEKAGPKRVLDRFVARA